MFYSHDLLGRKTPLGAIWTLAHGRKLSKGRIISINLWEICQEILQPGVPHSLRLQGILIGGVVIVYNKQQTYLLEDLQDMMRRVKAAGKVAAPEGTAAGTTAGRNTLKKDKNQARLEAITMMDMEDLLAPTADLGLGDDFLGLLDGGYSGITGSDASRGSKRRRRDGAAEDEEVADGLFIMPSMASDRTLSKDSSRSRSVSWATGVQDQHQQEQEVYGGLTQEQDLNQWNPNDEFFDFNTDVDLLGGMDLAIATAADVQRAADSAATGATHNTRTTTTTTSNVDQENPYDPTLLPDTDQQHDLMDLDQQPDEPSSLGLHHEEAALSDSQVMTEEGRGADDTAPQQDVDRQQHEDDQGARKAMARKQRKRKLGQAFVDDLDNLQIKSREYREWVTDHSALINRDRKQGSALVPNLAGLTANNSVINSMLAVNPQALLDPSTLMSYPAALVGGLGAAGASGLGVGLPGNLRLAPELLALFTAPVLAANNAGGKGKRIPEPSSPEVNNSTGDGVLPGNLHGEVHRDQLDLRGVPGQHHDDLDDEVQGRYPNMTLPDNFEMQDDDELHQRDDIDLPAGMDLPEGAELLGDEAHDQLMNLPFEDEVERLRAGRPSSTHSGSLHLSSPGGTERHTGLHSGKTDTTDDSMQGQPLQGPELSEGVSELKRALRMNSQDLEGVDGAAGAGMFYGDGNLEDLMPDVPLPDSEADEPSTVAEGIDSGRRSRSASAGLASVPSSQFPLIEETEPLEPTQHQQHGVVTKATSTVLSIFRQQLQSAGDAGNAANIGAGSQLSLFGLLKEGRLSRSNAAKLFYQICVTTNAGYVTIKQERAFGDVIIKPGRNLWTE